MFTPIVDMHCHLLPGIDDGPETMQEALDMARMASENGITHAVVTPHLHPGRWENTLSVARPVFTKFKREVARAGIPLELGLACEARLDVDLLAHLACDELPFLGTLNEEKLILLELPHGQIPIGADRFAAKLFEQGIRPIIAHPERNRQAMRNRDKLAVFEEMGCLFQITAGSLLGKFGQAAEDLALTLLESPSTFLIASDAHNTTVRIPELLTAKSVAAEVLGEDKAMALVSGNPWRLAAPHFQAGPPENAVRSDRPIGELGLVKGSSAAGGVTGATYDSSNNGQPRALRAQVISGKVPGRVYGRTGAAALATPIAEAAIAQQPEVKTPPVPETPVSSLESPQDIHRRLELVRRLAQTLPNEVLGPLALELANLYRDRQNEP